MESVLQCTYVYDAVCMDAVKFDVFSILPAMLVLTPPVLFTKSNKNVLLEGCFYRRHLLYYIDVISSFFFSHVCKKVIRYFISFT